MNTSSFLRALRARSVLPLAFKSGADTIAPGYHLTEVKDVSYRTMDCGAMTHRWTETQFELWVPPSAVEAAERGHMAAAKFLNIVDRVQAELPLDGESEARVFVSFGSQPAALYTIDRIGEEDGRLVVALQADRARCKARERSEAAGCGCGVNSAARTEAACCA